MHLKLSSASACQFEQPNSKHLVTEDNSNVAKMMISVFGNSRKHGEQRRKCWLPSFSLFPQCFQKPSVRGSLKLGITW